MTNSTSTARKTILAIHNGKTVAKRTVGGHKDYKWALISTDHEGRVFFCSCRSATGRAALVKEAATFDQFNRLHGRAFTYAVLPVIDGIVTIA